MGTEFTIRARSLAKIFNHGGSRVEAVTGVDLDIRRGEMVALVGPSGSGKSVLLEMLALGTPPSRGELRVLGRNVADLSDEDLSLLRKAEIGYVVEESGFIPTLNCLENVMLPRLFLREGSMRTRGREVLGQLGLETRGDHLPREVSSGELQRVAVARALINDPGILIADEPTANLDLRTARMIWGLLKELSRERGLTVVVATHDLGLARTVDRVLMMNEGRVVRETTGRSVIFPGGSGSPGEKRHGRAAFEDPETVNDVVVRGVGVTKRYPQGDGTVEALRDVNFEVRRGEIVAVTGPSASGKSTLLHLVGGLTDLTGGRIWVEREEVPRPNPRGSLHFRRSQVGFLLQSPQLVPSLNVTENVLLPTFFAGTYVPPERLERLLAFLRLSEVSDVRVSRLSSGEKQRVALGRALISEPSLILADEPTARLDPEDRQLVLHLFESLSREGFSFLLATHSSEVAACAHRIYHLVDGRIGAAA
jgi:putative ABC transport system ATP-binding protein